MIYKDLLYPALHPRAGDWHEDRRPISAANEQKVLHANESHAVGARFEDEHIARDGDDESAPILVSDTLNGQDDIQYETELDKNEMKQRNKQYSDDADGENGENDGNELPGPVEDRIWNSHLDEFTYHSSIEYPFYGLGWCPRYYHFDIDPTILRVNKQIYSEALSLLYKSMCCYINFSALPYDDDDYPPIEVEQTYQCERQDDNTNSYCALKALAQVALCTKTYFDRPMFERDLGLGCLRNMAHIEINTDWSAILGAPVCNRYEDVLPPARLWDIPKEKFLLLKGGMVLQILEYLDQRPAPSDLPTKRIRLRVRGGIMDFVVGRFRNQDLSVAASRRIDPTTNFEGVLESLIKMMRLLQSLRRSRAVIIE